MAYTCEYCEKKKSMGNSIETRGKDQKLPEDATNSPMTPRMAPIRPHTTQEPLPGLPGGPALAERFSPYRISPPKSKRRPR